MRIARAARDAVGDMEISCSQVTQGAEAYRIGCLAHLGAETLAAAAVHVTTGSEPGRVRLQRGECEACPLAIRAPRRGGDLVDVESGQVPGRIERTVAAAHATLTRSGVEVSAPIEVVVGTPAREALPQGGVSRRDLLRGMVPKEQDDDGLSVAAPTKERGVLLAAVPGAVVEHPVAVHEGCTGCRICERVCPEGAFGWSGVGTNGLLWVSPADCTACGICVQACPEDVLDLDAVSPADTAHRIARIQPRGCTRCGRGLAPGEGEVCTVCSSRRSLLDDVWKHLG